MGQSRLEVTHPFEVNDAKFPLDYVFGIEETTKWAKGALEARIANGFLRYVPGVEGGDAAALLLEDARKQVREMIEAAGEDAAQILKAAGEKGAEIIRHAEARAALVAELSDKTVAELVAFADEKYQVKLSQNIKRAELIERILALPTPGA